MNRLDAPSLQRALRLSLAEGSAWALMVGLAETYFIAIAVHLGASPLQLGLVVGLPLALGGVGPLGTLVLLRLQVRRRPLAVAAVVAQVLVLCGLGWRLGHEQLRTVELLLAICLYQAAGQAAGTAWSSWYGDLVPAETRGRWFGRRNQMVYLSICLGLVIGGLLMQHLAPGGVGAAGGARAFALLMGLAAGCRIVSGCLLAAAPEPHFSGLLPRRRALQVVSTQRGGRALRLLLLGAAFQFTVYWCSPYFAPFELENLHFTYLQFMISSLCVIVAKAVAGPLWGRTIDRQGARPVFLASLFLIALVPLPWLWAKGLGLVLLSQAWSGSSWSGFEVGYLSLLLENSRSRERPYVFALQSVSNGWMQLAGALVGSLLILPRVAGYREVFAFSVAGRLMVAAVAPFVLANMPQGLRPAWSGIALRMFGLRAHGGFSVRPVLTNLEEDADGEE